MRIAAARLKPGPSTVLPNVARRSPPGPARGYEEMPAGLGYRHARTQSCVAARAQRNCSIRTAKRTSKLWGNRI